MKNKIRLHGRRGHNRNNSQVFIESTLVLLLWMLLFVFITRLFIWFNERLVDRQERYQGTRYAPELTVDFYGTTPERRLQILPQAE